LEHIDFHDCVVRQSELDNGNLCLQFNSINILRTHPDNDTGKAKETDDTLVCFKNVTAIKAQCHDSSKAVANAFEKKKKSGDTGVVLDVNVEEIEIKDIYILDALNNLDIISLSIEKIDEKYICKIDGHTSGCLESNIIVIEFEYVGVYVCFNNLTVNAWFENGAEWNGNEWVITGKCFYEN
jgi:hypothetical protein